MVIQWNLVFVLRDIKLNDVLLGPFGWWCHFTVRMSSAFNFRSEPSQKQRSSDDESCQWHAWKTLWIVIIRVLYASKKYVSYVSLESSHFSCREASLSSCQQITSLYEHSVGFTNYVGYVCWNHLCFSPVSHSFGTENFTLLLALVNANHSYFLYPLTVTSPIEALNYGGRANYRSSDYSVEKEEWGSGRLWLGGNNSNRIHLNTLNLAVVLEVFCCFSGMMPMCPNGLCRQPYNVDSVIALKALMPHKSEFFANFALENQGYDAIKDDAVTVSTLWKVCLKLHQPKEVLRKSLNILFCTSYTLWTISSVRGLNNLYAG